MSQGKLQASPRAERGGQIVQGPRPMRRSAAGEAPDPLAAAIAQLPPFYMTDGSGTIVRSNAAYDALGTLNGAIETAAEAALAPSAALHKIYGPGRMSARPASGLPMVRRAIDDCAPTRRYARRPDRKKCPRGAPWQPARLPLRRGLSC